MDIYLNTEISREENQTELRLDIYQALDGRIDRNESSQSGLFWIVCLVKVLKNATGESLITEAVQQEQLINNSSLCSIGIRL